MTGRLFDLVRDLSRQPGGQAPDADDLADAVWLSSLAMRQALAAVPTEPSLVADGDTGGMGQRGAALAVDVTDPSPAVPDPGLADGPAAASPEPTEPDGDVPGSRPGSGEEPTGRARQDPFANLRLPPHGRLFEPESWVALRSPAAHPLPGTLEIGRALRPLRRRTPSRTDHVLDPEATAHDAAEARLLLPVHRPEPVRWLDLALVVDASRSMSIWRPQVTELRLLLERLGAFRDLRLWWVDGDRPAGSQLALRSGVPGVGTSHSARELVDPRGLRVVLVVTDGVGRAWANGVMERALFGWGSAQPVAVLQLLPQRLWPSCLPDLQDVRLTAPRPAAANAELIVTPDPGDALDAFAGDLASEPGAAAGPGGRPGGSVPVPVVELSPRWLARWAALVADPSAPPLAATVLHARADRDPTAPDDAAPAGPGEVPPARESIDTLLARFQEFASVEAQRLARYLAAAPLSLPVMRLVREVMLPRSRPSVLAEVFLARLLQRVPEGDAEVDPALVAGDPAQLWPGSVDPDAVLYDFVPGVRERLLASLPQADRLEVLDRVSEFIAARLGFPNDFRAFLSMDGEVPEALKRHESFARVALSVLAGLGGGFEESANRLSRFLRTPRSRDLSGTTLASEGVTVLSDEASVHSADLQAGHVNAYGVSEEVSGPGTGEDAPDPDGAVARRGDGDQVRVGAVEASVTSTEQPPAPVEPPSTRPPSIESLSPGRRSTDSAEPAIFGDVPFRNPHFTGRERMLEQLHGQLWTGTTQMALLPHAVHGLGGVGKTQLAIEYAWRYAAEYDVVWWVPSESQSTARRALVELADRMEIAPQAEVDQRIVALLNALRVGRPYRRWLLVYDNAQSPDQLQGLLPVPTGHVLITSRDAEWSVRAALLEVNVFSRAESVTLLQRRGAGIQADVADRLADVLGDLPLALDQAAAWQAQTGTPAAELVRLLSERMPQLLRDQVPGRPASVMATWDLAFAELRRQSPGAARLLELLAFFGAEPVAIPILRDGRRAGLPEDLARVLGDDLLLRRAIRDINRYALAKVHPSEDRMEVHRLVQTVLRDRLTPEQAEETRDSVHRILGAANPGNPDVTRTHERHAELWPHITPSRVIFGRSREGQRAALDQIRYRFNIGDYASSMRLGRAAVEAWRASLGADDELTLIAQRHLAIAIRERGEYAEAAVLNQDTFARVREVFGENHEHTLATRISLSRDLRLQGRFEECKVHDEETLTLHLTRFGDDDPETIKARNNLATTLRCLGRGDDALAIDEANRAVAARIFGELHSSALGVWANLGRDLIDSGRYKEAVRDLTTVAALAVEHWGPGHRMSLRARMNLAIALRRSGELERARALAEELHKAVRELMPPRHETVLSATVTYANAVLAVGEAVRAVPLLEEAWQGYRAGGVGGAASGSAFGPDHPFSQAAAVDLAVSLRAVGENRRARELDEQAVTSLSGTVGPDHPYTLVAQINLALDLSLAHEHSRARQLSGDAFERSQRSRGADRPETLICGLNHALDLRADGADDAGHELLVRMRGQLLDRYGSGHPAARAAAEERRGESDLEHWDT